MSSKMKAAQISKPGGDWELVERDIPEPGAGQVRVKVEACGICHSDVFVKEGLWPGLQYPRVPGHEIAGRIDAVGDNVTAWKKGQRVGVGWHGGHCFVCEQCRRGDFAMCVNRKVTGIDFDGGYAEYMIAPAAALAAIPDELAGGRSGAVHVRGRYGLQRAAQFGRARRRRRGGARHRRTGTSRSSVRAADGIRDRRARPREGQGSAGAKTGRASLHRFGRRRCGRRNCKSSAARA